MRNDGRCQAHKSFCEPAFQDQVPVLVVLEIVHRPDNALAEKFKDRQFNEQACRAQHSADGAGPNHIGMQPMEMQNICFPTHQRCSEKISPCAPIVCFEPEMAQTIREEIEGSQNIIFHPRFVPAEQIQFYMNACDAVVLPYRQILTSSAAMLAMSFGRACVAPQLSGMLELLDDRGAFLYEPDQLGALAEAIHAAADNREKLDQMGIHNLAKVSGKDWTTIAAATLKIYQRVC